MRSKNIDGVVFDLDGTLYSMWGRRIRMTIRLWRDIDLLRHVSRARAELRTVTFETKGEINRALCRDIARRTGIDVQRVSSWYENQFYMAFIELLKRHAKVRPGLPSLLERLRSRGVRTAVVSDYGRVADRLLALGLDKELFDSVCSSEDFGVLKPSPRPLVALAKRWDVEPRSVVVVGDREDLDGKCADAAGMGFLGVRAGPLSKMRSHTFVSWQRAMERLDKWSRPEDNAVSAIDLKSRTDGISELDGNERERSKQLENMNESL